MKGIIYIQLSNTGLDQIMVNDATDANASLKNDDFIAIIDGSTSTISEVILEKPSAMSLNPTSGLYYVASGDSHWFNVINREYIGNQPFTDKLYAIGIDTKSGMSNLYIIDISSS
jgi:hypothetical protein